MIKSGSNYSTIIFLTQPNSNVNTTLNNLNDTSENVTPQPVTLGGKQNQKSIFVCTFCQVFSLSDVEIIEHINTAHANSLPVGVAASRFVSKLQALPDKTQATCRKKVGRPRKDFKESAPVIEEKPVIPEPIPKADGLYWCAKCDRSFKKARQLTNHVCCEVEDELGSSSSDSDTNATEYKVHMDVNPRPWSRKTSKKSDGQNVPVKSDGVVTLQENPRNKVKLNWREDPDYILLFPNEAERIAFENHVNSIDYSCIDDLFTVGKRKIKANRERSGGMRCGSSYTCTVCKKKMNYLTHIRMHCLTHTDLNLFTCPKCPYQTNTKGGLYSHIRSHTGNVFRCSQCSFQTIKRSHLLDHEETHSTVAQICRLCKNTYKTVRSLIAHVKRYHNNPGGKKYIKSFSSKKTKETFIKCKICQKRFKSQNNLEMHNKMEHLKSDTLISDSICNQEENSQKEMTVVEDPLAEIVLNNLLQQKSSESVELYEDVFEQSELLTSTTSASSIVSQLPPRNDFDKNLNLGILEQCIQNSNFVEEVMCEALLDPAKLGNQPFNLHSSMNLVYPNSQLMSSSIIDDNQVNKTTEPMSAENELFKKCQRAPAYVCCVCSSIYINPETLKVHLKQHVNSNSTLMKTIETEETDAETDAAIDSVCRILQETSDSCVDQEQKLEELFTSSLDMMYYLPEVKVVLENDPSIFDAVWDDISNFSMTDKYDDSEELRVKSPNLFR